MLKYITILILFTYSLLAIDIKMGGGVFNPSTKGLIFYQNNFFEGSQAEVDNTAQYHGYFWSDVSLPLPFNPHILTEYYHMTSTGNSLFTINANNKYVDILIDSVLDVFSEKDTLNLPSTLRTDMYDLFIYYDVWEEGIFPIISMGAGIKHFNYNYFVKVLADLNVKDNGGATIPMLYTKMHKDIERYFTSFDLGMKYYVFGDSDIYDLIAKMTIKIPISNTLKAGIELGYKDSSFNIKGADIDHVAGDMRYKGFFGGMTISF